MQAKDGNSKEEAMGAHRLGAVDSVGGYSRVVAFPATRRAFRHGAESEDHEKERSVQLAPCGGVWVGVRQK